MRIIPRQNHQPRQPHQKNRLNDFLAHHNALIKPIKGEGAENTDLGSDFLREVSSTAIKVVASTAIVADNTVAVVVGSTAGASRVAGTTADQPAATVLPLDVHSGRLKVADRANLVAQPKVAAATAVETLAEPVLEVVGIQQGVVADTPAVDNDSETGRNARTSARYLITNAENGLTVVAKARVSKVMSTNDSWKTTV